MEKNNQNENVNKMAFTLDLIVGAILILSYIIEFLKGSRSLMYVIVFASIIITPIVLYLINKKTDKDKYNQYVVSIGYLVMYAFVLSTTKTILSTVYILPMILILTMYKNFKYMIGYNVVTVILNVIFAIYNLFFLQKISNPSYLTDTEIQLAIIVVMSIFSILISKATLKFNNEKLEIIENEKTKVEKLLEELRKVSNLLNTKVEVINEKVGNLQEGYEISKNAFNEVLEGTNNSAEATSQQVTMSHNIFDSISQTEDLCEDFTSTTKETLTIVKKGNENIDSLNKCTAENNKNIEQAIKTIKELKERVQEITNIVEFINSIAEKTNLLSLNASIEAARAGEVGRGFSVVANEIRDLANSSKESANRINEYVETVIKNSEMLFEAIETVENGFKKQAELIDSTNSIFSDIYTGAENTNKECDILKKEISTIKEASTIINDNVSTLMAVIEETTANTTQSVELNEHNIVLIDDINSISLELSELSKKLNSL